MQSKKKYSFRDYHLLQLLEEYNSNQYPLDYFISLYFKNHKALGSKDRPYIAEMAYGIIRWKGLLDYICGLKPSWEKRLQIYKNLNPKDYSDLSPHIRVSFPIKLFELISNSHENPEEICLESNFPAPTTVRINSMKTTRNEMLSQWKQYQAFPCKKAPYGIIFPKKINFFTLPEFKKGFFEIQDEGSQLIAEFMKVQPHQKVLDYCAGSAGKTLAFAPKMGNTGQIYIHDIRPGILLQAKKRLKRAGIQNIQIVSDGDKRLKSLKKKMDWVLVDAPCSGTGTLRRNPDMKWKFSEEMLNRLVGEQRMIFEKALSYVKPSGHIIYATCSLLQEENQQQVEHFLKTYPISIVEPIFQSVPIKGEMDGFFAAVFKIHNRNDIDIRE